MEGGVRSPAEKDEGGTKKTCARGEEEPRRQPQPPATVWVVEDKSAQMQGPQVL